MKSFAPDYHESCNSKSKEWIEKSKKTFPDIEEIVTTPLKNHPPIDLAECNGCAEKDTPTCCLKQPENSQQKTTQAP
jgi:hypothetical protein